MNALYFILLCGAQKLLGQDIRTRQALRLSTFLRWESVYERQGSEQKRKSCARHKVFHCCYHTTNGTLVLVLPLQSFFRNSAVTWARHCRQFISVSPMPDTNHISSHWNLTTLSSWHYSSFHLTEVEIKTLAQNVAASKCPSQSQLFTCISTSLPLLSLWLHEHWSPHLQTPLYFVLQ